MKSYTRYLVFLPSITYNVNYFKDPGLKKISQRLIAMVAMLAGSQQRTTQVHFFFNCPLSDVRSIVTRVPISRKVQLFGRDTYVQVRAP